MTKVLSAIAAVSLSVAGSANAQPLRIQIVDGRSGTPLAGENVSIAYPTSPGLLTRSRTAMVS